MDTRKEDVERAIELARQIVETAGTPQEAFSSDHQAAQSALAGMGVDLALIILGKDKVEAR